MCCRAVAWTASAAVEAPNALTPDPTLDPKPHPTPQTPCPKPQDLSPPNRANEPLTSHSHATHKLLTSHSLPLLFHAFLFPKRTHLRATQQPLPSSSLLPKAPAYEPLTRPATAALHTLSVRGLCSLAAPSHQRHQISQSCDFERCFKNVPTDNRRIKSLTS